MNFALLGPFEATVGGRRIELGRRRERLILAVLLLEAGRFIPLGRLADLLWDDVPPEGARAAMYTGVARLRRRLTPCGLQLVTRGDGYQIDVDPECVDAHRFSALVADARAEEDPDKRSAVFADALALWRGPLLADTANDRLRERIGGRLQELRQLAIEGRAEARLCGGRPGEVIADLAAAVEESPARERLTELLMTALYRTGRQADALAAFHALRRHLGEELGIEPSPELRALHERMLRQDPALMPTPAGSDHTVTAGERAGAAAADHSPRATVPAQLPADLPGFAGRRAELTRLDDALRDRHPTAAPIVVVSGTAGVGKTALAVHWAHRVRAHFPDGQLHINLRGYDPAGRPLEPEEAVRAFLVALDTRPDRVPADPAAQAALLRTLVSDRQILILLDNARTAEQVRALLPGSPGCLVLITSRDPLASLVATHGALPVGLDLLSTDDARELLGHRLGRAKIRQEPDAVRDIIARCAHLPLALAIVAAQASTPSAPHLAGLADQLADSQNRLAVLDAGDDATNVQAVLAWSYDAIGAPAAHLFRLLSLVPGADVTVDAAATLAAVPPADAVEQLDQLVRAGLLTVSAENRFTMHDLLRGFGQTLARRIEDGATLDAACLRLLDHYRHGALAATLCLDPQRQAPQLPPPGPGTVELTFADQAAALAWFTAEHAGLIALARRAAETGMHAHCGHLAWAMGTYLSRLGHWHDWVAVCEVAVASAQTAGDPAEQATAHRGLGSALAVLGRFEDAHIHFGRATELFTRIGDEESVARTRHDHAWVLDREDRHAEAIETLEGALRHYAAVDNHPRVARVLNSIGFLSAKLGEYEAALDRCLRAVEIFQKIGDQSGEAATWDSLGLIHYRTGRHDEATRCLRQAVQLYRSQSTRLGEAESLHLMGDNFQATGATDEARAAWEAALQIFDDLGRSEAAQVTAKLRGAAD
jgi:DNA-binding SARP family transcriptional activator/tetratricopeptide (TPR) repeat protein